MPNQTIAERMNLYLNAKGISRRAFCDASHLNASTINRQLKGESALSSDTLQAFVFTYRDINLTWLLLGTGEMTGNEITVISPAPSIQVSASAVADVQATPHQTESADNTLSIADALAVIRSQREIIDHQAEMLEHLIHNNK